MDWHANASLFWDWDDHTPIDGNYKQSAAAAATAAATTGGGGGASSCSELGSGSSSKSTVSASFGSSAIAGKERELVVNPRIHAKDKFLYESSCSPTEPRWAGMGESQMGLKLGKRTYFEDVSAESNMKNSPSSLESTPAPAATTKKSRVSLQSSFNACCQVEGCNIDLSGAKDYHRKHRVCENHSKCPKVVIAGEERRFCQQCSRFHELSEFDQKKKSCRRRLSDHNARRRKPRPNLISFNSTACSLQFYDDKYHTNLLWNKGNCDHMISMATTTNEGMQDFKLAQTEGLLIKSTKCGTDKWPNLPNTKIPNGLFSIYHDVDKLLPLKGTTAEVLDQGIGTSAGASNLDGAPDLRRALSLLSTSSWNSTDPRQSSSPAVNFADVNHASVTQPMAPLVMSSSSWICSQPAAQRAQLLPFAMLPNGNQPQDFLLQNTPYEDPR